MRRLLSHPTVKTHVSQLWKFAVSGGIGSIIDLGSLTLFVEYFGIDPRLGAVFSTLLAVCFVFTANKFFTFRNHEKKVAGQVVKFVIVYGVAVLSNILLTNLFIFIGLHYLLSKVIAIGIGAVWNYVLSHGFIFKKGEEVDIAIV